MQELRRQRPAAKGCLILAAKLSQNSLLILLLIDSTSRKEIYASANITHLTSPTSTRQFVGPTAPYALVQNNEQPQQQQTLKNILFRLDLNQTDQEDPASELWISNLTSGSRFQSGSAKQQGADLRSNANLKKLLQTLNDNNFTSELRFFDDDINLVNISISVSPIDSAATNKSSSNNHEQRLNEILLEELILEANSNTWQWSQNGSVLRDNHRNQNELIGGHQVARSRPLTRVTNPLHHNLVGVASAPSSPLLRMTIEVKAENYTARKVAEEVNVFALKLLQQLNIEKLGYQNVIQAPFGVYQGLALLLSGSMGETAKELDKALLGSQSVYENTKLTHDQDRARLMASLNEAIRQLQSSSSAHFRSCGTTTITATNETATNDMDLSGGDSLPPPFAGGSSEQHLIVANNLLFSPSAYEISSEFKSSLNAYYKNTAVTKIEIGSTESIQIINSWIRRATMGVIPTIINKKSTFDEFNVMVLLCTSWLAQEWKDNFYKISSSLKSSIRLKGQTRSSFMSLSRETPLLEFVDDNRRSHFVDYIKSEPSKSISHYHSMLNGLPVDIVTVPFHESNHLFVALTPLTQANGSSNSQLPGGASAGLAAANSAVATTIAPPLVNGIAQQLDNSSLYNSNNQADGADSIEAPDSSSLSRLISTLTGNPRKAMRSLWKMIAPEIITKQTLKSIQAARQKNITIDDQIVETSIPPFVELSIPLIRAEADSSISAALNHVGIVNSFEPNQANFIGINGHPFNYFKLHLSNVLSKTTFNLNERGINYDKTIKTLEPMRVHPARKKPHHHHPNDQLGQQQQQQQGKADFTIDGDDPSQSTLGLIDEVKLNKPFLYLICDIKSKLILYTGIMRNPTQEGP